MNDWFRVKILLAAAFCGVCTATAGAAGPDIPSADVRLLVPGGAPSGGGLDAGIEFRLPAGWHTYWRSPGDAGLPPTFDTSGSANLGGFVVAWPVPERRDDDGLVTMVYNGDPILPVRVVPADPDKPVDLRVRVDFGYCREICVPGTAEIEALLGPDGPVDADAAGRIAAVRAALPRPESEAPANAPRVASVERIGDDRKTAVLKITVAGGEPERVDLFAEPPDGWYLTVPRRVASAGDEAVFELPLKGMPRKAAFAGAAFRFTLVGPDGAFEAVRELD